MKQRIQMLLYCIALIGIVGNLIFDVKPLGIAGYAALLIVSAIQIIGRSGKKRRSDS